MAERGMETRKVSPANNENKESSTNSQSIVAQLPSATTVTSFISSVGGDFKSFVIRPMSEREEKAFKEVITMLAPSKLGGENETLDQNDIKAVLEALLKDPTVIQKINSGIWNEADNRASAEFQDRPILSRIPIVRRILWNTIQDIKVQTVQDNYWNYYAQGQGEAMKQMEPQIKGALEKYGVNPKERKEDIAPRQLTLAEIEQFKGNLEILNNYLEKVLVQMRIGSVPVPENGISAKGLQKLKDGEISTEDSARKIPFVPSKSKFVYATDAQLVEFGIPSEQVSAYRKGNHFYYNREKDSLTYCTKDLQENKDGSVGDVVWGQKSRNCYYDQYGRYTAAGWIEVDETTKMEAEKLDRYTSWKGRSTLTLEKVESFGKVFNQPAESFEGKEGLAGKQVYRVGDYVAIGEKNKEGKVKEWYKANPSEKLDIEQYDKYSSWQKTYQNELNKVDCKTIAELGINSKYLHSYDFYFKEGSKTELFFVSKTNFSQGVISATDFTKQTYPNFPSSRQLSSDESSLIAKTRSRESEDVVLTRIDPQDPTYQSMLAGYDKKNSQFFVGRRGEIVSQYEVDGKKYTAVNYGSKEVFSEGSALGNTWVMANDYQKDIEKIKREEILTA